MPIEGTSLEVRNRPISISLTPAEVVENATTQARLLMSIVEQTHCYQEISGKKYLQVEAWETIGAFNNTHAETKLIVPIIRDGNTIGYEASVQLWKHGEIVGGATMPCYFTENCCKGKDGDARHKACMSAAQTFATSKAYRMNYSYVAILAGYQPLPAEEITSDMVGEAQPDKSQHWCKEHNTAFFKRGKMKVYAHPIKGEDGNDTGKWCNMPEDKPKSQPKITIELSPEATGEATEGTVEETKAIPTWEEVRPFLTTLHTDKVEGWATIDAIMGRLIKLGAAQCAKVEDTFASLSDDTKVKFAEMVKKEVK